MPSGLGHLPEQVLAQVLGGLILSHFRSHHPENRSLHLLREYKLQAGSKSIHADFAIFDEAQNRTVAVLELVRSAAAFRSKRTQLDQLRQHTLVTQGGQPFVFALVIPESIKHDPTVHNWTRKNGVDVVTYPL
jgi:hypothetical protein